MHHSRRIKLGSQLLCGSIVCTDTPQACNKVKVAHRHVGQSFCCSMWTPQITGQQETIISDAKHVKLSNQTKHVGVRGVPAHTFDHWSQPQITDHIITLKLRFDGKVYSQSGNVSEIHVCWGWDCRKRIIALSRCSRPHRPRNNCVTFLIWVTDLVVGTATLLQKSSFPQLERLQSMVCICRVARCVVASMEVIREAMWNDGRYCQLWKWKAWCLCRTNGATLTKRLGSLWKVHYSLVLFK